MDTLRFENPDQLIEWYKPRMWQHARLARLVAQFLKWKVEEEVESPLPVLAFVTHREKSIHSLRKNLLVDADNSGQQAGKAKARYSDFKPETIGDLAGTRLIFYFKDDLTLFCQNRTGLQSWFGKYSRDKLKQVTGSMGSGGRNEEVPGYESYHFPICVTQQTGFYQSLNEMDSRLLTGLYCEVQMRTILRHAWAEAEHDMRYKIKRRSSHSFTQDQDKDRIFVQLAASIEDADTKLVQIKSDMAGVLQQSEASIHPIKKGWAYTQQKSGYELGGVHYRYEVLDVYDSNRGIEADLDVTVDPVIFDVDSSVRGVTARGEFKHSMWNILRTEEPEFISKIRYDGTVVRVSDWQSDQKKITVQPALYSDEVVTNHTKALTKPIPGDPSRTVHHLAFDPAGSLLPFCKSPLANTVGVCCVAKVETRFWLICMRSPSLAFEPDSWGCSASGALEWAELGHWNSRDFQGWFKGGMLREIEEELGFATSAPKLHYLGFARELGRAGKPQVFFYLEIDITSEHLQSIFRTYTSPAAEFQKIRFLDEAQARDVVSSDEDKVHSLLGDANLSEELRMNLALALRYTNRF